MEPILWPLVHVPLPKPAWSLKAMDRTRAQILSSAMAFLALLNAEGASAQGLESPETIDAIVGTPVHEEEAQAAADTGKVIAAIEKTAENIGTVRKTTNLDSVDIVFLADAAPTEGGPPDEIEAKLREHEEDIGRLRQEIEGNAMLFHAIDSRQLLLRQILGIEFKDNAAIIYAAAKPAQ
jgi:hypothetical protein